MIPPPPPGPPLIGPSIARLRLARGWSQSRLAAELCAAAGVPTLSRHEVSRWERQLRVPGDFWLGWLAVVLAAPGDLLPDAAAWTRRLGTGPAAAGGGTGGRSRSALLALAQRWLADPHGPALGAVPTWLVTGDPYAGPGDDPYAGTDGDPYAGTGGDRTTGTDGDPAPGMRDDPVAGVGGDLPAGMHDDLCAGVGGDRAASDAAARLAGLRRLDDLAGGADLTGTGRRELRRIARGLVGAGPADRRRLMPLLAEAAQLCGWLAADAGAGVEGLDAYRLGLRAAVSAGDPAFAGHVLGSASHLLAGAGDPDGALVLAATGYAGCRAAASPGLRALLLHRVALAAALGGRPRTAGRALAAAHRAADRGDPGREPPWLYWLDGPELAAMTGRTLVALRRPRRAVALLDAGRRPGRPRSGAVYGSWLARAHLQLGEVQWACAAADTALLDAIRAGSPRAVRQLTGFRRRLGPQRDAPAVRRHLALVTAATPYLPRPVPPARP